MKFSQSDLNKMVYLSLMASLAIALSVLERFVPMNFVAPGIKLGIANAVSLICLYLYGFRCTFLVFLVRVFVVAFMFAGLSSLMYSFTGGLLSLLAMFFCIKLFQEKMSPVGVSVIGAFFHNFGQVLVLAFISKNIVVARFWFPILIYVGILTGIFIGFVVLFFLKKTKGVFSTF